ncbi:MAG: alkaline phosphatase family protein, partial [Spirochaetota bacterium]|nr:alkaline phosphatase family protein [Spirochaetota bacterium]
TPFNNEDRKLIPSPHVPTYDLKPEMSAYELENYLLNEINENKYDVIIVNFANPDMVGHTGIYEAALKAVETVDICVGNIVKAIQKLNGTIIITADHGNIEHMYDENKMPITAHTTNRVPFFFVGNKDIKLRNGGILADIAPTILELLNIKIPIEMTGKSLLIN